jgi:hypothetical protein
MSAYVVRISILLDNPMPKHRETEASGRAKRKAVGKGVPDGVFVERGPRAAREMSVHATRVSAVMAAAQRSGLLEEKSGRIGGRVSPALVERAKARTGIEADTDLIEFALANIALEDKFADSFKAARGTVDADLNLGF